MSHNIPPSSRSSSSLPLYTSSAASIITTNTRLPAYTSQRVELPSTDDIQLLTMRCAQLEQALRDSEQNNKILERQYKILEQQYKILEQQYKSVDKDNARFHRTIACLTQNRNKMELDLERLGEIEDEYHELSQKYTNLVAPSAQMQALQIKNSSLFTANETIVSFERLSNGALPLSVRKIYGFENASLAGGISSIAIKGTTQEHEMQQVKVEFKQNLPRKFNLYVNGYFLNGQEESLPKDKFFNVYLLKEMSISEKYPHGAKINFGVSFKLLKKKEGSENDGVKRIACGFDEKDDYSSIVITIPNLQKSSASKSEYISAGLLLASLTIERL